FSVFEKNMQINKTNRNHSFSKKGFVAILIWLACPPCHATFGLDKTVSKDIGQPNGAMLSTLYAPIPHFTGDYLEENAVLEVNSNGFNAQKQSGFIANGVTEGIGRGLTIVHFTAANNFEFKTYDTYGSEMDAHQFIDVLKKMIKDNAKFAILAHDSASNELQKYSQTLKMLGFPVLGSLSARHAYVMVNFEGIIKEKTDPLSITLSLEIPKTILKNRSYFPKITYDFEPSVDRYIAHAGGSVDGIASTNSLEALNENYKKGFRLFELDIIETKDGEYIAAHDWNMWARFTDFEGELPVSHAEFLKHKIYGDYTTLDMNRINAWFSAHPDAILVTDKVNDIRFANSFVDKKRLIMELFSLMAVEEAAKNQINAMISQETLGEIKGDKLEYLAINNIKYVALSRRIVPKETDFLLALKNQGVKAYVYNVNFDVGKDEKYVQENEIGLVYGMYADKWVFDIVLRKGAKSKAP
ncbi:MAG: interleukin-like EMT inducer domain-containing protein, partial [Flavobacteriaceae bacterium]